MATKTPADKKNSKKTASVALDEEKQTYQGLTAIAESGINGEAEMEAEDEEK